MFFITFLVTPINTACQPIARVMLAQVMLVQVYYVCEMQVENQFFSRIQCFRRLRRHCHLFLGDTHGDLWKYGASCRTTRRSTTSGYWHGPRCLWRPGQKEKNLFWTLGKSLRGLIHEDFFLGWLLLFEHTSSSSKVDIFLCHASWWNGLAISSCVAARVHL